MLPTTHVWTQGKQVCDMHCSWYYTRARRGAMAMAMPRTRVHGCRPCELCQAEASSGSAELPLLYHTLSVV